MQEQGGEEEKIDEVEKEEMYIKYEEESLAEMCDDTQPFLVDMTPKSEQTKLAHVIIEDIIEKNIKVNQN